MELPIMTLLPVRTTASGVYGLYIRRAVLGLHIRHAVSL